MPEIITRLKAIELKIPDYFTGKPCKNGHISLRTVSSRMCKDCASAAQKAWVDENAERNKQVKKEYRKNNVEKIRKSDAEWAAKNPEKVRESNKRAVAKMLSKDPDCRRRSIREWMVRNRDAGRVNKARYRALKLGCQGEITAEEIKSLVIQQDGKCAYCQAAFELNAYHIDHKTPLARGGSNSVENIHICCQACNLDKRNMTHEEYLTRRELQKSVA